MKKLIFGTLAAAALAAFLGAASPTEDRSKTYSIAADDIEACSCPLFCGCFFNSEPNDPHMCQFNNVFEFRKGSHYGSVDLSGVRAWLSGDLGGEALSKGKATQAIITFDRTSSPEQREALGKIFGKMYPVSWEKMDTRVDSIEFHHTDGNDHAKMASGMAEVTLKRGNWEATKMPTVIRGLKYFAADGNDGFVLAKGTHYFHGEHLSYDYTDMNGFFVTVRMHGTLEAPKAQAGGR
jgi:hypothetical protein